MANGLDVLAPLTFIDRDSVAQARGREPIVVDYRRPQLGAARAPSMAPCVIHDARPQAAALTLDTSGFTLVRRASAVRDWFDAATVMRVYYQECRDLARELTGASHTFTFDHIIREPGRQTGGGGLTKAAVVTTAERGGGYVSAVHMDYTDASTWRDYLALHGVQEPKGASRVLVLNFWRPLFGSPARNPLALCDARTVRREDLLEMMLYGYGHEGYSWHDIGISVFQVASSPEQRWYYYADMQPDEVLLFKTYDSLGVIGRTCPHTSFTNASAPADTPARVSVELRVLCYVGAQD